MNFNEYAEKIKNVAPPERLSYRKSGFCLRPSLLPLMLAAVGGGDVIRVPETVKNDSGGEVSVIGVLRSAFAGNERVTDIILPPSVEKIEAGAFAGCKNLQNITIPKRVTRIGESTFAGCVNLKNIYYEGSREEWERIEIVHKRHEIEFGPPIPGTATQSVTSERMVHIPGNEPLFAADIHFGCTADRA